MDIPRPRRAPTWRDSPWWNATWQSAISFLMMTTIAAPLVAWFGARLLALTNQPFELHTMLAELGKGSLAMLPYLWAYYFALERIAHRRKRDYSPTLYQP